MRCPTLAELPEPTQGKNGWPWTIESPQLSAKMPDGRAWPKISIVTPSYNQGEFIEETIRSILLQGYPELEYIIIDGGSTDDTIKIIKNYDKWITYWLSEKDDGQADAINKGVAKITGHIFNWINTDDYLSISVLQEVAYCHDVDAISAFSVKHFSSKFERVDSNRNLDLKLILSGSDEYQFRQPGLWISSAHINAAYPLSVDLHYAFDWEMLIKLLNKNVKVVYSNIVLANFRHHPASKTESHPEKWLEEGIIIRRKLLIDPEFSKFRVINGKVLRADEWKYLLQRYFSNMTPFSYLKLTLLALARPSERLNKLFLKVLLGKNICLIISKILRVI